MISNATKIRVLAIAYFLVLWFSHMADDSKRLGIGIFMFIGALSFIAQAIEQRQ